ncbi:hypothetical protein ACWGHM_13760 [Streptomyces sp. NPDC054904]|uniref:hypothetical protein n=1 Tax=unclassified Streptomyces TaxID=2593676 RepID=UPI002481FF09|nr:hypothetical protein [Streptomyces sp. Isolate_45]MDA5284319.1 hypothetical protein [Streptomyces sp. Isolate_45]
MSQRSFYWCRACRQPLYATSSTALDADRDWEVDHQQPGACGNDHLMPLEGTAPTPEDLPDAPRVLRLFGS